jgi:dihydropteroate synthase
MGVINTTPDSFSDGGRFDTTDKAFEHAQRLISEGADLIDIGGESTRPGSQPVALEEELDRTIPLIRAIREISDIPISIDTNKSEVMRAAVDCVWMTRYRWPPSWMSRSA